MKKIIKVLGIVSIFIILIESLNANEARSQTVIQVVGDHAPPYRIIQGKEFLGIYIDAMKEIGERIGIEVEFEEQPFQRALLSMKNGKADVMLGPNKDPEREAYMVYTTATFPRAKKIFYVHPDSPPITKYEDLQGKKIAVHRGKVYFDRFDNDTSLKKEEVNSYLQAITKVVKKRNEVVIMPELEGDYLLKEQGIQLKKSPFIIEGKISYITISKKSPVLQLQKKIEEAMEQIKLDGTMDMILERYGHQ